MLIVLIYFLLYSDGFAQSPPGSDDEVGDLDEDSDSSVSSDSDQDSDDDGGSSIGMSDDVWSGEPRELSTTTIKSFIGTIDNMIPDLDNDQEREEWRERKSELEDELSRRNNNR